MQGVGGVDVGAPDLSFLNSLNVSPSGGTPLTGPAGSEQVGNPVPGNSVAANPLPATSSPFNGAEQLPGGAPPSGNVGPANLDQSLTPNAGPAGTNLDQEITAAPTGAPTGIPQLPDISGLPYVPPPATPAVPGPAPFNMGGFMNWFGAMQPESQMQIARAMQSWLARQGA